MALCPNSSTTRTVNSLNRSTVSTFGTRHSHGSLVDDHADLSSWKRRASSGEVPRVFERCFHCIKWPSDDRDQSIIVEFPFLRLHSSDYLSSRARSDSISDVFLVYQLTNVDPFSNTDTFVSLSNVCIERNSLLRDEFCGLDFGLSRSRCHRRVRFVDDEFSSEETTRGIIPTTIQRWTIALHSIGSAQRSIPLSRECHCRLPTTGEILHSSYRIENQRKCSFSSDERYLIDGFFSVANTHHWWTESCGTSDHSDELLVRCDGTWTGRLFFRLGDQSWTG